MHKGIDHGLPLPILLGYATKAEELIGSLFPFEVSHDSYLCARQRQ